MVQLKNGKINITPSKKSVGLLNQFYSISWGYKRLMWNMRMFLIRVMGVEMWSCTPLVILPVRSFSD